MNIEALLFLRQYLCVVAAALVPVIAVAFAGMPMSLGHHPGEQPLAQYGVERHMT